MVHAASAACTPRSEVVQLFCGHQISLGLLDRAHSAKMQRDNSKREIRPLDGSKARLAHHRGQSVWLGEFSNRFRKILVRLWITRERPANQGQQTPRIPVVKR